MSITQEICELEQRLLDPRVRSSPAALSRLLADDFVEFGSYGRVYDKRQVIDALQRESGVAFSLQDFQARALGPGVVLATFRVVRSAQGCTRVSLRSSIWEKKEGSWQMVFHQGTLIGDAGQ